MAQSLQAQAIRLHQSLEAKELQAKISMETPWEGPFKGDLEITAHLRTLVPKAIPGRDLGARVLKRGSTWTLWEMNQQYEMLLCSSSFFLG